MTEMRTGMATKFGAYIKAKEVKQEQQEPKVEPLLKEPVETAELFAPPVSESVWKKTVEKVTKKIAKKAVKKTAKKTSKKVTKK